MAKIVRYSQAPLPRSLEDELRARLTQNPELPPHTAARRYEARSLSLAGDDCFTRSLARMLQAPDALFDEKQVPAREVGEPRIERKPGEVPPPSRNPDWRESRGCDGGRVSCLPLLSWGCLAAAPGSRRGCCTTPPKGAARINDRLSSDPRVVAERPRPRKRQASLAPRPVAPGNRAPIGPRGV